MYADRNFLYTFYFTSPNLDKTIIQLSIMVLRMQNVSSTLWGICLKGKVSVTYINLVDYGGLGYFILFFTLYTCTMNGSVVWDNGSQL